MFSMRKILFWMCMMFSVCCDYLSASFDTAKMRRDGTRDDPKPVGVSGYTTRLIFQTLVYQWSGQATSAWSLQELQENIGRIRLLHGFQNFTRVDVAVDLYHTPTPVFENLVPHVSENVSLVQSNTKTAYIGDRARELLRIYEKGKKEGQGDYFRVEIETHGGFARAVCQYLERGDYQTVMEHIWNRFNFYLGVLEIERPEFTAGDGWVKPVPRDRNRGDILAWAKRYNKSIGRLAAEHPDYLLEQFGLVSLDRLEQDGVV